MGRITKWIDKEHACFAVCEKECPDRIYNDNPACMCTSAKSALKKLLYYEDMEEQGKLMILPFKVNDIVHSFYESDIEGCFERGMEVEEILEEMCEEIKVIGFHIRNDGLWIAINGGIFNPYIEIPFEEFGKTVFLTEQEAEKALEGMKND